VRTGGGGIRERGGSGKGGQVQEPSPGKARQEKDGPVLEDRRREGMKLYPWNRDVRPLYRTQNWML